MQRRAPKRVLGYARVSSIEQTVGTSLQDQQAVIKAYAQTRGLAVHRMFVEAESGVGERIEKRLEMQALMASVQPGDLVSCDKIDRWSRDAEFTYRSVREILSKGAHFFAIGDNIDPSTNDGDSALSLRILVAREEHKRIKQRLVGTRKLLRARGFYAEGAVAFGYQRQPIKGIEKNVLVVDKEAAKQVRDVFRRCVRGQSLQAIADAMGWNKQRVRYTLDNRLYLGEVRDLEGLWIPGRQPAIVDAAMFLEAQQARLGRRLGERKARDDSRTGTWWLRDLARCGHCEAKLVSVYGGWQKANGERRGYFRCYAHCVTAYVDVRGAEAECEPLVLARLEALCDVLASAKPVAPEPPTVDAAERRERLQRKRERYLEAFADGHLDRDELRLKLGELDTERTRLDALAQAPSLPSPAERRETLRAVEAMRRAWAKATPRERRAIVGHLAKAALLAAGKAPRFDWRDP